MKVCADLGRKMWCIVAARVGYKLMKLAASETVYCMLVDQTQLLK